MSGCLMRLVLLPLTIALLYPLLLLREPWPTLIFPAEGAEATAVIAGIFLWFALLSLLDVRRYAADLSLLNKFLRDGERTIISGPLEARAPLLESPFSKKECVGYHYKVTHTTTSPGTSMTKWTDYEGYALVPAIISSPLGDVKILAESNGELFYEIAPTSPENAVEHAGNYFESVEFGEKVKGTGDFRMDKKIGDAPNLNTCDFEEKLLGNNEVVLLSGIYSAEHGGISPDPDDIMRPFHIVPGGEFALKRKIRNRRIAAGIGTGLGCATIAIYMTMFASL